MTTAGRRHSPAPSSSGCSSTSATKPDCPGPRPTSSSQGYEVDAGLARPPPDRRAGQPRIPRHTRGVRGRPRPRRRSCRLAGYRVVRITHRRMEEPPAEVVRAAPSAAQPVAGAPWRRSSRRRSSTPRRPCFGERLVHRAHAVEHLLGDLLRLLPRRVVDLAEVQRLPVLDRHLREPQRASPRARARSRGSRPARPARRPRAPAGPDPAWAGRAPCVRERPPSAYIRTMPPRSKIVWAVMNASSSRWPAADREDPTVVDDEVDHRRLEELRLGHEMDLAAHQHGHEEVVPEAEVVRARAAPGPRSGTLSTSIARNR